MKKRYLKAEIEWLLVIVLSMMTIITLMIDSIELSLSLFIFGVVWFTTMFIIYRVLKTYGRGVYLEKE